jgi:hypothetical protein
MSKVLFLGGRLDSFSVVSGTPTEVSTAGRFDATYSDCATQCSTATDIVQGTFLDTANAAVDVTSGQTAWLHFQAYWTGSTGSGTAYAYFVDSSGQPWLMLRGTSTTAVGLFYNSGTGASPVWTQVGTNTFVPGNGGKHDFDMRITIGSPHSVELIVNNNSAVSGTFTQASLTTLRGFRFSSLTANQTLFSQVFATEGISTVNAHVKTIRATGAGGNTGWTGAFTNVNEAVNSDATFDSTAAAGNRQSYAMADITLPAGYSIPSVFHWLRAKNDGTAPNNIKSVVRQSTTDYDYGSNMANMSAAFAAQPARYDTDPASAAAWTQTTFNSAEFGYLSVT